MVQQCLLAVHSLASGSSANADRLGAIGACVMVVTAMVRHSNSETIAECGCRAIDGLSRQHDLLEAAGTDGRVVPVEYELERALPTVAKFQSQSYLPIVPIYRTYPSYLSIVPNHRTYLSYCYLSIVCNHHCAGACGAVVSALKRHSRNEAVARWGCRAVYCLSVDFSNSAKLGSAGT